MEQSAETAPPPSAGPKRWCLVHAKTGQEFVAETNLKRQNYQVFLPRSWRTTRHARKIQNVAQAYFPGYLFVHLDLNLDRWRPINGTLGVIRLLATRDQPLTVPPAFVEALQTRVDANGFIQCAAPLAPGDAVRVVRGPFADQLAVVESLSGPDRVRVLLQLVAGSVPLLLDRAAVSTL